MMNDDNQISKVTKLFGFIGEYAGVSRFAALVNKKCKADSYDMMMIPMNIREDDLFFTLANMKKSHVNGAIISNEYREKAVEVLDVKSELVTKSGMCDIIFKEGETLRGDIFTTRVLLEKLKDVGVRTIALLGINSHAKAFALMACGFEVHYFYDSLEELMSFCDALDLKEADVNRITSGMNLDFSTYDAVLDFSDFENLDMIEKLAVHNFDMKNKKEYSSLKTRASHLNTLYVGYDDLIDELTTQAYRAIVKG
ncbi:hypothetical protein JHD48_01955 [Sulfurimonas sp. SAG-AH-194-I05]|nr:hypothetical protein [Sulfurimonas sp. SAG-AH-194-I05]MDF1874493.1 hypothetical protein [Sulfurimonas sp. SAG-AH-194-I05]